MRSVYTMILLWCLATLVLSMSAWMMVSRFVYNQMVGKDSFFDRMNVLVLGEARAAYETGGPQAAGKYLKWAAGTLGGEDHFIDRNGIDLVTGENLSSLASQFRFEKGAFQNLNGRVAAGVASSDGKYRLLVIADSPFPLGRYIPYYLPILAAVALLCWALASRIAGPLRQLVRSVDRFGRGDLTVRVNSRRRDEIGDLGAAFDRMAERIGTLLTSERRLLQDISHELRSPLARLSFAAEMVRIADDRESAVATLQKEIQRLTELVGQLIEATRADGEPSSVPIERLHLDEVLTAVVQDCRLDADAHHCKVVLNAKADVPVEGSRELLRRAIENVLRNAINYTPQGSVVEVKMDCTASHSRISVRDYGPGVPDAALDKIFQPFFRVDDSRTGSTGGVGLGLTITHRAICAHNGRIVAENAKPGLRITFEIPMAADVSVRSNHRSVVLTSRGDNSPTVSESLR